LFGESTAAVSAMKCTPQKTMTSASVLAASRGPLFGGHVLDLGALVVVGEDDRVALAGERPDLTLQVGDQLLAGPDVRVGNRHASS
jgi:hypothetical protein